MVVTVRVLVLVMVLVMVMVIVALMQHSPKTLATVNKQNGERVNY